MYMSRVTLDIDGKHSNFETLAVRAYYSLRHIADDIDVNVSSSGHGLHIIGWFEEAIDEGTKDTLRRTYGDDVERIELDYTRRSVGHRDQVLWTDKGGSGTADDDVEDVHRALDRVRAYIHSDYDAMRLMVNEGVGRAFCL